jgi:hypothetical protein
MLDKIEVMRRDCSEKSTIGIQLNTQDNSTEHKDYLHNFYTKTGCFALIKFNNDDTEIKHSNIKLN